MFAHRSTDTALATRFRTERVCTVNHEFFFDTREGQLMGPYASREEALKGVEDYIRQCQARQSR
ncbi:DUF6316 family protein [Azotobacter chroococcum]|uniref:DUF6316 domain-containing protein n=1 Tax=Azotobacter chroococcum TaxID=353 RepID=A0AAP9YA60_9GAMM|nr:DUF6316 family protein [Azotobacter chroococcum]QQE87587.1 hypothetical protein GKQ51_15005 [Azotobacter chroococcum]